MANHWTQNETEILLNLWGNKLSELETMRKHTLMEMSSKFEELGFKRTPNQIGDKIKYLLRMYKKEKNRLNCRKHNKVSTWIYYADIDKLMEGVKISPRNTTMKKGPNKKIKVSLSPEAHSQRQPMMSVQLHDSAVVNQGMVNPRVKCSPHLPVVKTHDIRNHPMDKQFQDTSVFEFILAQKESMKNIQRNQETLIELLRQQLERQNQLMEDQRQQKELQRQQLELQYQQTEMQRASLSINQRTLDDLEREAQENGYI